MIRVEKTHLPVAALTHPGMKGKNNEDRFGVSAFRTRGQPATPVLLAVLSDGIGGHRAGEVASELAVNIISKYVADSDGRNPPQILGEAIQNASQAIYQQAVENPDQQGMGATCACAWVAGDRLYTATVGDSRIYLKRGNRIRQLSTDHTWIQEALERGIIQPEEIQGHPNAHVIRRYLGSPTPPEVDFRIRSNGSEAEEASPENQGLHLQPEDCVILCSDGLTDLVSDEEISTVFHEEPIDSAGQRLIDLANQRGGHDNITLVAIEIPPTQVVSAPAPAPASAFPRVFLISCLGIILLAALVGALAGGYLLYFGPNRATQTPTPARTQPPLAATPTLSRSPVATFGPSATPSPIPPGGTIAATRLAVPGSIPSITPWPTNTGPANALTPLPVVTVQP